MALRTGARHLFAREMSAGTMQHNDAEEIDEGLRTLNRNGPNAWCVWASVESKQRPSLTGAVVWNGVGGVDAAIEALALRYPSTPAYGVVRDGDGPAISFAWRPLACEPKDDRGGGVNIPLWEQQAEVDAKSKKRAREAGAAASAGVASSAVDLRVRLAEAAQRATEARRPQPGCVCSCM